MLVALAGDLVKGCGFVFLKLGTLAIIRALKMYLDFIQLL